MNEGLEALDRGNHELAIQTLQDAIAIDDSYFLPWFNLGLAFKGERRWNEALDTFLAAWARITPEAPMSVYTSVLWNVGITASLVRNWRHACRAWGALGYPIGWFFNEPPSIPLGYTWVQRHQYPPVLARRLDPARAQIVAADPADPLLQSGVIVVNDGTRSGERNHQGAPLGILPVLGVLYVPSGPGH